MENTAPLPRWVTILRNAAVLGAITAVSNIAATQDFSSQAIYTGIVAGVLVGLVEIKHSYKILPTPQAKMNATTPFFFG